ncbi:MAG TPA: hypothetical protein PLQ97_04165 [Myxococcota bacterium]|nr:hypothetical protein [Myxococcota bacterium]HQK49947.1 hypothetical protein [Myxococcota bacterium]
MAGGTVGMWGVRAWVMGAVLLGGVMLDPAEGWCDKRNTVWSYEPKTMPRGEVELEYYLTVEGKRVAPARNSDGTLQLDDEGNPVRKDWTWSNKYQHQAEVEVGVTDRFDLSLYTMFSHTEGSPAAWDGYKIRARVMPVLRGQWPVDVLFYLEWIQGVDDFAFEEKVILGRSFGGLFLTFNAVAEQKGGDWGKEWAFEFKPSFALGYEFNPHVALSLETQYKVEYENSRWSDHGFWLGPTLSLMTGPVWLALGGMYQPTHVLDFPRWQVRAILGVFL